MSTMESNKKTKHDPSPSSSSTSSLSKLEFYMKTDFTLAFSWKPTEFPQVYDYMITDYLQLCGFNFRLHLSSKGESEDNSGKYVGLYLEIDASNLGERGSVCCKVNMSNHMDDVAQSVSKYVFRRYTNGKEYNGQKEFAPFDSLQGPESKLLANGTDMHIHGNILILEDHCFFEGDGVQSSQGQQTSQEEVDSAYAVTGVYEGKFTWTINNYSFLKHRFKHYGMLRSPPFPIGKAHYHIHLENVKNPESQDDENHLSMFLHGGFIEGEDKSAWCVVQVELMNKKLGKPEKISSSHGRLGLDLTWLHLMKISYLEDPDKGWYILENDTVEFVFRFTALKEKIDTLDFGAGTSADPDSEENKNVIKKEFFYSWKLLNFSTITNQMNKYYMRTNSRIKSRKINIGETEISLMIFPWGVPYKPDHVALYLQTLKSSICSPTPVEDETSFLVHFKLGMQSMADSSKLRTMEKFTRLKKDGRYYGYPDFILESDIYSKSVGYISDGALVLYAYIHVVEETLEMDDLTVCTDGAEDKSTSKQIRWKVDKFLTWVRVSERNKSEEVESSYVKVLEGFHVCICIAVCRDDGILYGGLRSDRLLEKFGGHTCHLSIQIAVLNQKNLNETQWKDHSFWMKDNPRFNLGNLSDLLKEDAGYILEDKVVFACKINKYVCFTMDEYRKKKGEE